MVSRRYAISPLISLQKVGQYSPHISLHHLPITAPIPGTLPAISSRPTSTLHIRPLSPFLPATASPPLAGSSSSTANPGVSVASSALSQAPRIFRAGDNSGLTSDQPLPLPPREPPSPYTSALAADHHPPAGARLLL
jgi:hypothetical protein